MPVSAAAPILFFGSGAAGLVLQVAWFRMLALGLGGTLVAATVDLAAFMAGLALGAALFGRRAARLARPLRAYGLLEVGAGLAALATLPLLRAMDSAYAELAGVIGDAPGVLLAAKVLLAAVALLPATTFMGGTLPVLCEALVDRAERAGTGTGALAGLNTAGAVAGTLVALFAIMPAWGLTACVLVAAAIDLIIGGCAILLSWRVEPDRVVAPEPAGEAAAVAATARDGAAAGRLRLLAALLFVVGAAGMAYEVLWTRALAFYFGSGAHAFALMLAVVLAGYALGAFLGGALSDRTGRPGVVLWSSQALLALAAWWFIRDAPRLPDFMYELALRAGGLTFTGLTVVMLLATVQVLLPAAVLMGMALPAAARAAATHAGAGGLGRIVGRLASANALGTVPGAAFALWVLVPALGLQRSLVAVAGANAAVALAALAVVPATTARRLALAGVTVVLLAFAAATLPPPLAIYAGAGALQDESGAPRALALEESPHGTVTLSRVEDSRGEWLSLEIDAVNVAGTSPPLLACQAMQGHLPMLLHPHPRRIVHVGFGSGGTADAVRTWPGAERIQVVEINPAVLRTSRELLGALNERVFDDPRVAFRLEDGRNFLLGTRDRWDVILSDSIHPRYRGNATLYTVDYFRLCRSRLAPGGLVSTWLPIYSLSPDSLRSIVASMREVFPTTSLWYVNSTVNEFVILVGRTEDGPLDAARMDRALAVPGVRESLAAVGVDEAEDVLDGFIAEGGGLDALIGDVALHFDDHPWVELESAAIMDRDGSWRHNLGQVVAGRTSVIPHAGPLEPARRERMARREAATTAALRAHLAYLGQDPPSVAAAAAEVVALAPEDREPWEVFGVPESVRELGARAMRGAREAAARRARGAEDRP